MTEEDERDLSTTGRSLMSGTMLNSGPRCWAFVFLVHLLVLLLPINVYL